MSGLEITYDWLDFDGHDEPAIERTFATLRIVADGQCVTRVLDKRARTTLEHVVVPLYPVAEWIAANWWTLLEECHVPEREASHADYLRRHALRTASEGYALPDLRVIPEGDWARLKWLPRRTQHQTVDFLEGGEAHLPAAELHQALADLVNSVSARLDASGTTDTWLQREWKAIQSAEPEEREFCSAAAWLGLDPYEVDDATADLVLAMWRQAPPGVREDIFRASSGERLAESVNWVEVGIAAIQSALQDGRDWSALRKRVGPLPVGDVPWRQGYLMAQDLRARLGLHDRVPLSLDELLRAPFPVIAANRPPVASLDGLFGCSPAQAPCCYTAKRRPESQRFVCARGLMSFFYGSPEAPLLLSSVPTRLQQQSRAFAAELLAPAQFIRPRLGGDEVSPEQVADLAAEFAVSPYVIEHQIQNHRLALLTNLWGDGVGS
jgi:hypothetical protein